MKAKTGSLGIALLLVASAGMNCGTSSTNGNSSSGGSSGGSGSGSGGNGSGSSSGSTGSGSGSNGSSSGNTSSSSGGTSSSSGAGSSSGTTNACAPSYAGLPSVPAVCATNCAAGTGNCLEPALSSATSGTPIPTTAGCVNGTCMNPMCQASTAPGYPVDPTTEAFPSVGFEGANPAYIPKNVVIPTLDDVPDGPDTSSPPDGYSPGNFTKTDLAFLDANNYHWDFFINADNWDGPLIGDATMDDPDGHNDLVDIATKHYPANHTVYHTAVGTPTNNDVSNSCIPQCCDCAPVASNCTATQCTTADPSTGRGQCNEDCQGIEDTCELELQGVEALMNKISNGGTPHLTRFRPPYGLGYAPYGTAEPTAQAAIAKFAVAVGWNVDSTDANQNPGTANANPTYVVNTVTAALAGGAWGIVLTHGVMPWTAPALPTLYDPKTGYMVMHGYKIANVEDAICWKYGMHSWDVINKINNYTGCDKRGPN